MLTSQEGQRPGAQMERWLPSLCSPSTQRLSASEEAGVYQRYTQLCCPSVCTAQGGLALKLLRPGHRSPPARPTPPPEPQLPGVRWRCGRAGGGGHDFGEGGCERLQEQQFRCGRSTGTVLGGVGLERKKGLLWLLTTASTEFSLIIRPTLCSIQSSCLGEMGPAEPALPRENVAPGVGNLASLTVGPGPSVSCS